jgi:hypothetical protein
LLALLGEPAIPFARQQHLEDLLRTVADIISALIR